MNTLTVSQSVELTPAKDNKDARSHVAKYNEWLRNISNTGNGNAYTLFSPDLAAYRDHLLAGDPDKDQQPLAPVSVSSHLSSVRAAYRKLLRDRDLFYMHVPSEYATTPADQKAWVDEVQQRIKDAIEPDSAPVDTETVQDVADSAHTRLTKEQGDRLIASFGTDTLKGLRDTAIVALMLCTGIREAEVCNLKVDDLRQHFGGELALSVKLGKGRKSRLIPYGGMSWVLVLIDKWLERAGISDPADYVFCSFWKDGQTIRGKLSPRQVQRILEDQPQNINGKLKQIRPHDLRRSYARQCYLNDMDILAIKDNLGHASQATTLNYIGTLDASHRQPKEVFSFDLSTLNGI